MFPCVKDARVCANTAKSNEQDSHGRSASLGMTWLFNSVSTILSLRSTQCCGNLINSFYIQFRQTSYCCLLDLNVKSKTRGIKMSVKIILTDLDGTLLAKSQVAISPKNMSALKAAAEKGVHIVPCTGRSCAMLPPELLSSDFVRYIVSCHGARVYDRVSGKTIYEDVFSPEESYEILKILEKKGIYLEVAANGEIYVEKHLDDNLSDYPTPIHHVWFMYDRRYIAVENIADYFLENRLCIEKINTYSMPKELCEDIYNRISSLPYVKHTREGVTPDLEFSHRTLDKMAAVRTLLGELDITLDEAFGIGDSSSDYDLLCAVGTSVAMGNAIEADKRVAKYITDKNTDDGVAKAIEKYVLSSAAPKLPDLKDIQKSNSRLVCIDSDGCAVDTMEIKHKECFCTAFIECFGLQAIAKYAREAWDYTNLYSKTRGFYRMKTLIMSIELLSKRREVVERGFKLPDITLLKEWCQTYDVLSDATLREFAKTHEDKTIETTLEWSAEVNKRIARVVKGVPPFMYVRESLDALAGKADIVVVSATPTAALENEWTEHDIKKYTSFICGQEYGSKKDIISRLIKIYGEDNVLMIGDAMGDFTSANAAGAAFYPICPNNEDGSWKLFYNEVSPIFTAGKYTDEVQTKYASRLDDCLADSPSWEQID